MACRPRTSRSADQPVANWLLGPDIGNDRNHQMMDNLCILSSWAGLQRILARDFSWRAVCRVSIKVVARLTQRVQRAQNDAPPPPHTFPLDSYGTIIQVYLKRPHTDITRQRQLRLAFYRSWSNTRLRKVKSAVVVSGREWVPVRSCLNSP